MKKRALIFLNGKYAKLEPMSGLAHNNTLVIGVDGGTRHIATFGLSPQIIIGDMDSLPSHVLNDYLTQGALIMRHRPEKDETDFELSLDLAVGKGCSDIIVYGALGGRTDHMLANILAPLAFLDKSDIRLVHGLEEIRYITSRTLVKGKIGDVLSLLPVSGDVTGVKTTGLRYPLQTETLTFGKSRGISNVLTGSKAMVTVASGTLLCIHKKHSFASSGKEK